MILTYEDQRFESPDFGKLLEKIWESKGNVIFEEIIASPEYKNLEHHFSKNPELWVPILKSSVKKALYQIKTYKEGKTLEYSHGKIGYKDMDGLNSDVVIPYKTVFELKEMKKKHPEAEKVLHKIQDRLLVDIGHFSYAHLIKQFNTTIIGVSGSLFSERGKIDPQLKEILQSYYGISLFTYIPSAFYNSDGIQHPLDFKPLEHTKVISRNNFHMEITNMAQRFVDDKRSVIIVFNTSAEMMSLHTNESYSNLRSHTEPMDAKTPDIVKNKNVRRTSRQEVTLITGDTVRGMDFVCYDKLVNNNGGVVVIVTYLPESLSQFIQIIGRTRRQGEPGSVRLIFILEDLALQLGISEEQLKQKCVFASMECYTFLIEARDKLYHSHTQEKSLKVKEADVKHQQSIKFFQDLAQNNMQAVIPYLVQLNEFERTQVHKNRYIALVIDGSGSMNGGPWNELLDNVKGLLEQRIKKGHVNDMVTVIVYNHNVQQTITAKITELKTEQIRFAGGGTDFAKPILEAHKILSNVDTNSYELSFMFMSDGQCPKGINGINEMQTLGRKFGPKGIKTLIFAMGGAAQSGTLRSLAEAHGFGADYVARGASVKEQETNEFVEWTKKWQNDTLVHVGEENSFPDLGVKLHRL